MGYPPALPPFVEAHTHLKKRKRIRELSGFVEESKGKSHKGKSKSEAFRHFLKRLGEDVSGKKSGS